MRQQSLFQKLGIYVDGKKFHLHHIDLNRENNEIENLIILSVKHHRMVHKAIRNGECLTRRDLLQNYLGKVRGRFYVLKLR